MRRLSCRTCGRISASAQCPPCARAQQAKRDAGRADHVKQHYGSEYQKNARLIRAAFTPGDKCVICLTPILTIDDLSIEHRIPVRQGGTSAIGNLGPAHRKCNYGRH